MTHITLIRGIGLINRHRMVIYKYQGDILSYSKQKKPANVLAGFLNQALSVR